MATIANISAYDGAATPVAHTLVGLSVTREGKDTIVGSWRELVAAVPNYAQVSLQLKQTLLKSGVVKNDQVTIVPVMESISGQNAAGYTAAPKVAYEDKFVTTSYAHPRSTQTSRRLTRQLHVNILGNVTTSVAAATSGFSPDLFDSLIPPS